MHKIHTACLVAFLAPLAACSAPESVPGDGEIRSAALGVTVTGLTLTSGAAGSNERCVFDVAAFNEDHPGVNLEAGRQIRIFRPGEGNVGACTVENDPTLGPNDVRMNAAGFARVEGDPSQSYTVSIDTEVATTAYPYSATTPPKTAARNDQEFFEWRRNAQDAIPTSAQIVAIAPHGGGIEQATAEQARVGFYDAIPSGRVVDWECYGYNDTVTGTDQNNGFDHWHITSTEINPASFPILQTLVTHQFPYAVAFHGFGSESFPDDGSRVFVGGRESRLFLREITDVLNTLKATVPDFEAKYQDVPSEVGGTHENNLVNRFNAAGRGLQLEQGWKLRNINGTDHSPAIAAKVATVYACLTDPAVTLGHDACMESASVSGPTSSAQCGRFVADAKIPSNYGAGFTVRGALDVSALDESQCATVKGYVSIYRFEGGRFERRAGGSILGTWTNDQCVTSVAPGDDDEIDAFITDSFTGAPPASGEDTYRVTVAGSYGNGTPLTGVASITRNAAPAAHCCSTDADCNLVADCSCNCIGIADGESLPICKEPPTLCVADPCRQKTAVCNAGFCAATSDSAQ